MKPRDFDFDLPNELIAQQPSKERDGAKLLVYDRSSGRLTHQLFSDLTKWLRQGDLLILNDSLVIPARIYGHKTAGHGRIEMLLLEENECNDWWVLLRPGKRVRAGTTISLHNKDRSLSHIQVTAIEKNLEGHVRVKFAGCCDIKSHLHKVGVTPLPPYITRTLETSSLDDSLRYQTVYARRPGSVAAPTAGLHFTNELLRKIQAMNVEIQYVTLHVGWGTFAPMKAALVEDHVIHEESYEVSESAADAIRRAKAEGARIIAVGTTTVRVLESVAKANNGEIRPASGKSRLFIYPPFQFRIVDAMITNFHLPQSTLLMLVSAFASPGRLEGRSAVLAAYQEAIRERYRFFSYGDAMLIA